MSSKQRTLKLGTIIQGSGSHIASWKHPGARSDADTSFEHYVEMARKAEAAKLDFIFMVDGLHISAATAPPFLNRFEPTTILSALAGATSSIGLISTLSTTYNEPFNLARQLASLDMISKGRAGWNVVTSAADAAASNFGKERHPEHGLRYKRAIEFVQVVKGLWDSWEDDAFLRDRESGRFFDPAKLHELNHHGEFYDVAGPLNIARSVQGQPVTFQAGSSDSGRQLAALEADAVYAHIDSLEEGRQFYSDIKSRAAALGRNPDEVLVFPNLKTFIGTTLEEAEAKYERVCSYVAIEDALDFLGRFFNEHDFSAYPLDEPFPEVVSLGENSFRYKSEKIVRMAKEGGWTLRQTALRVTTPKGPFFGTADEVADNIQLWFETGAADGFVLGNQLLPDGLDDFTGLVLPLLRERGLFRKEYESHTLRGNLGLGFPENRYTVQRYSGTSRLHV